VAHVRQKLALRAAGLFGGHLGRLQRLTRTFALGDVVKDDLSCFSLAVLEPGADHFHVDQPAIEPNDLVFHPRNLLTLSKFGDTRFDDRMIPWVIELQRRLAQDLFGADCPEQLDGRPVDECNPVVSIHVDRIGREFHQGAITLLAVTQRALCFLRVGHVARHAHHCLGGPVHADLSYQASLEIVSAAWRVH
jgi:hypothetical protein